MEPIYSETSGEDDIVLYGDTPLHIPLTAEATAVRIEIIHVLLTIALLHPKEQATISDLLETVC